MNVQSRSVSFVACLTAAAQVSGGCKPAEPGGYYGATERVGKDAASFYLNNYDEPEYLDPGKAHDASSTWIVHQMFEGLTEYDAVDAHPVPGVATHWEQSADNTLFRFHLRADARWSDGKPVTAADFEYSWKRVLRPATASMSATNMYCVKNAEGFHQRTLRSLKDATWVTASTHVNADQLLQLKAHTALRVIARSPMKVTTAIEPFSTVPSEVVAFSHDSADEKAGRVEELTVVEPAKTVYRPTGVSWMGSDVAIAGAGRAVRCNGAPDRWFAVERNGKRGFLPGCLLGESSSPQSHALVALHDGRPTFRPPAQGEERKDDPGLPEPLGFVPEAELIEDESIVGVRAVDALTLEVQLEQPTPYFTDLTSYPTFLPVRSDVVESFNARGEPDLWVRPESIVVNGPYILDKWKFRYEITLKPNPHYWGRDHLKIKHATVMAVQAYSATLQLYKAGDLDFTGDNTSLPAEYLGVLATQKDFIRSYYLSTYWYELNTKKPPLDNPLVRRALNHAIDKALLVDKVTRGGQIPATHYVPDFTGLGYSEQAEADRLAGADPFSSTDFAFDPERGRALLRQAGYVLETQGDEYVVNDFPPLEILYNTSEGHKQVAVAIQDMWRRHLGISATLRNEEWRILLKNARDGNFQILRLGWVADYNHPHTWMNTFLSSNPDNKTGWVDKEFDGLLDQAAKTADSKQSIRLYRAAEKHALDAMVKIPLYFYTKSVLVKPWVKGFFPNVRNLHYLKWLWVDPDWKTHQENKPAWPRLEFPEPGRLEREATP